MNKQETAKLLAYIAIAYPNGKVEPNEPTVNLWSQFTAEMPYSAAKAAVDSMIATLKFPPTIADIREAVARAQSEARGDLSAGEAWAKVNRSFRLYGYYDPTGARQFLGERIWDVIKMVSGSYCDMCIAEDEHIPARFERLYKAQAEKQHRNDMIPQGVRDHLETLGAAQGLKMIGGVKNS